MLYPSTISHEPKVTDAINPLDLERLILLVSVRFAHVRHLLSPSLSYSIIVLFKNGRTALRKIRRSKDGFGFSQPPGFGFSQPPGFGFSQPPGFGFSQPPGFGFSQPPGCGYAQPAIPRHI